MLHCNRKPMRMVRHWWNRYHWLGINPIKAVSIRQLLGKRSIRHIFHEPDHLDPFVFFFPQQICGQRRRNNERIPRSLWVGWMSGFLCGKPHLDIFPAKRKARVTFQSLSRVLCEGGSGGSDSVSGPSVLSLNRTLNPGAPVQDF